MLGFNWISKTCVCFEYQLHISDSKKMCIFEMDGQNTQRGRIIIVKLLEGRDLICLARGFIPT